MTDSQAPQELDFNCEYSNNLPQLLQHLNIALVVTSYQASRLMLVRSLGQSLDVNFKAFPRPMGLAADERGLTLGVFSQVVHFQREDGLLHQAKTELPRIGNDVTAPTVKEEAIEDAELRAYYDQLHQPIHAEADALLIARSSHFSGMINIHDIAWGEEGLWAVNSSFSCLCTLEPNYSFVPRWKPHFISELVAEDRCHLNGMAMKDGKPAFVTTFSTLNEKAQWRKNHGPAGTLMCVQTNEILLDGLAMPHSPRWHNNRVYFCNSGMGEVRRYDPLTGTNEVVAELPGFVRGMSLFGSILIVGLSKMRVSGAEARAPIADKYAETFAGIWLINLEDGREIGCIRFTGNVDQIYDVAVLPNCHFPELIEPDHPRMRNHFSFPAFIENGI